MGGIPARSSREAKCPVTEELAGETVPSFLWAEGSSGRFSLVEVVRILRSEYVEIGDGIVPKETGVEGSCIVQLYEGSIDETTVIVGDWGDEDIKKA